MENYILDTNFILRYLLADNEEQYNKAKKMLTKAKNDEINVYLEQAVFTEVIFVLLSFYKVPKDKIISTMNGLLDYKGMKADKAILQKALEIYKNNNIHIVDSLIAAKSQLNKLEILTFDKRLKEVPKEN